MRIIRIVSLAGLMVLTAAATARADGYASVFTGFNFGGDAGRSLDQALDDGSRLTWGGVIGGMSGGIFGAELDISHTNNFFGDQSPLGDNYVLTVMPALVLGIPVGGQRGPGIRPYATAGLGLIKRKLEVSGVDAIDDNDLAYSLGFGVNGYFSDHIGVRGDYRYFRNVNVDDASNIFGIDIERGTFDYSRATVGVLFRF
jgi:opacity protein-like surface antigen